MYGRYGTDTLGKALIWTYAVWVLLFSVLSIIFDSPWLYLFYWTTSAALIFWSFFRMFSKNIPARRLENERFCNFFKLRANKFRDRKTHVYRKCPKCKANLRLPKAKGKHFVVCPRCKHRFKVRG
jgi:uncharacterized C2H2 Zn-finger protein